MALNLWTVGEEAMAGASVQAADRKSLICLHTAAVRGRIKSGPPDNGDMWVILPTAATTKAAGASSLAILRWSYQRLLAVGERG
jgi:hypothetical protein